VNILYAFQHHYNIFQNVPILNESNFLWVNNYRKERPKVQSKCFGYNFIVDIQEIDGLLIGDEIYIPFLEDKLDVNLFYEVTKRAYA